VRFRRAGSEVLRAFFIPHRKLKLVGLRCINRYGSSQKLQCEHVRSPPVLQLLGMPISVIAIVASSVRRLYTFKRLSNVGKERGHTSGSSVTAVHIADRDSLQVSGSFALRRAALSIQVVEIPYHSRWVSYLGLLLSA
jgi:hypothetical protein